MGEALAANGVKKFYGIHRLVSENPLIFSTIGRLNWWVVYRDYY